MHRQYINGHAVYYDWKEKCFKYCDTHEQANYVRPCPVCGKLPVNDNDACLGNLGEDTVAACCGHGIKKGYILYKDGKRKELRKIEK